MSNNSRLLKACNGQCYSGGGLSVPEIKTFLRIEQERTMGRRELQERLRTRLFEQERRERTHTSFDTMSPDVLRHLLLNLSFTEILANCSAHLPTLKKESTTRTGTRYDQ